MNRYKPGITETSEKLCQTLLNNKQDLPENTIFRNDIFDDSCENVRGKNEARVFKDFSPLIAPSAEAHAALNGANHDLNVAIGSVNEGWNCSMPITEPRPQPDYAVGFKRSAFSDDQLRKLQPLLGDPSFSSYFMGTYYMHFPFFTCEVKCGSAPLDIVDRQNLHSMTLAVRGIVELFRLVKCEKELHREILAFSISHDHETVRIYGHFPVIEGTEVTYWRHVIRKYDFTERNGIEKWTAFTFATNVYDIWMPTLLRMIFSAVDDIRPEPDLEPFRESEAQISENSGLSQHLEAQTFAAVRDSLPTHTYLQRNTPDTSTQYTSRQVEMPPPTKKKKKADA